MGFGFDTLWSEIGHDRDRHPSCVERLVVKHLAKFVLQFLDLRGNKVKHSVSFEEAITVFADPLARIFEI